MYKYLIGMFFISLLISGCSSDNNDSTTAIREETTQEPECTEQNPTEATTTPLPGTIAQTCIDINCNGECDEDEL